MRGKTLIRDQSNFHFSRGRRLKNRTASRPRNVYHQPILRASAIYHGSMRGQELFVTNPSDFYVFCFFIPSPSGFAYVCGVSFHKIVTLCNKITRPAHPAAQGRAIFHIIPSAKRQTVRRFSGRDALPLARRGESRHIPYRKTGGHILRQSGQGREAATVTKFYMGRSVFHLNISAGLPIDRNLKDMF